MENKMFFLKKGRGIEFESIIGGKSIPCIRSSSSNSTNIIKIVEGLNHFLEYFYINDKAEYYRLGQFLFRKIVEMYNDTSLLTRNADETFNEKFYALIEKHVTFDEYLVTCVCKYVDAISIDNIDDKPAETEVTLDNINCRIIHCLNILIKIGYIFNGILNNTNNKKEDDYLQFIDKILDNLCNVYAKCFPIDRSIDELKSEIHHFFTEFYINQWTKENTENFVIKFSEFGMSEQRLADDARKIIWKALRKYTPPLKDQTDEELAKKYSVSVKDMNKVVYNMTCDWEDFMFANKNLSKFITSVYMNIVKNQDKRKEIPEVNQIDIVQDSYSDTNKDIALYSDRTAFLYSTRIKTARELMDKFIMELATIYKNLLDTRGLETAEKMSNFVKNNIVINKDHLFNQLIINKCLLAVIGEYKTYSNLIFGTSNQNILALFYFRVMDDPELEFLHNICRIITMQDSKIPITPLNDADIIALLNKGELEISLEDFKSLMNMYMGDVDTYSPSIHEMYDILRLLNSPKMLRNLLFPKQYPIEFDDNEETNPYEEYINRPPIVNSLFSEFVR